MIEFRNATDTNLHSLQDVNWNDNGATAVVLSGEIGSTLAVDTPSAAVEQPGTGNPGPAVPGILDGQCDVNETAGTYVIIELTGGGYGCVVSP